VATETASGNGAANAVTFLSGTPATKMLWPNSSIPSKFTICSVTRYAGATRGSILTCKDSPAQSKTWIHGHNYSMRGVARYTKWKTAKSNVGAVDDWLVMCGTNAGATFPGNLILDQDEIGTSSGGRGNCTLNVGYYESSDWALHSVLIWDYSLGTLPIPWHTRPCLNIQDLPCHQF